MKLTHYTILEPCSRELGKPGQVLHWWWQIDIVRH